MAHKLFIGGLAFSTSTERLRELFAQAGAVESAAVVTDRDTGNSRGFGFVEMASAEAAAEAVKLLNGKEVDGRTLKVELANSAGRAEAGAAAAAGAGIGAAEGAVAAAAAAAAGRQSSRRSPQPVFRSPAAIPLTVRTITSRSASPSGPSGSGRARNRRSIWTWR